MATIYFDKDEYRARETATITYADAPARSLAAIRRGGLIIHRKVLVSGGSGSFGYSIPATLGKYEAVLILEGRVMALDTMHVVSGVPPSPPPADKGYLTVNTSPVGATVTVDGVSCGTTPVTACELSTGSKTVTIAKSGYTTVTRSVTITAGAPSNLGTITLTPTGAPPPTGETRELDLGDWEVTWTLSGYGTLVSSIRVTDTGVTCLSVTAGACNSATPPGVTISAFTVTGYLKSAVAPPAGECNQSFRVTDTQTGNPIEGATISLTRGISPLTTNSSGRCNAILEEGEQYGWSVLKGGYETGYPPLFIACTAEKSIQLVSLTPPVTGFDDWVTSKGGKNAITGGDINELTDAYIGLEDVGFSVTGADVNKVTDYYLGLG